MSVLAEPATPDRTLGTALPPAASAARLQTIATQTDVVAASEPSRALLEGRPRSTRTNPGKQPQSSLLNPQRHQKAVEADDPLLELASVDTFSKGPPLTERLLRAQDRSHSPSPSKPSSISRLMHAADGGAMVDSGAGSDTASIATEDSFPESLPSYHSRVDDAPRELTADEVKRLDGIARKKALGKSLSCFTCGDQAIGVAMKWFGDQVVGDKVKGPPPGIVPLLGPPGFGKTEFGNKLGASHKDIAVVTIQVHTGQPFPVDEIAKYANRGPVVVIVDEVCQARARGDQVLLQQLEEEFIACEKKFIRCTDIKSEKESLKSEKAHLARSAKQHEQATYAAAVSAWVEADNALRVATKKRDEVETRLRDARAAVEEDLKAWQRLFHLLSGTSAEKSGLSWNDIERQVKEIFDKLPIQQYLANRMRAEENRAYREKRLKEILEEIEDLKKRDIYSVVNAENTVLLGQIATKDGSAQKPLPAMRNEWTVGQLKKHQAGVQAMLTALEKPQPPEPKAPEPRPSPRRDQRRPAPVSMAAASAASDGGGAYSAAAEARAEHFTMQMEFEPERESEAEAKPKTPKVNQDVFNLASKLYADMYAGLEERYPLNVDDSHARTELNKLDQLIKENYSQYRDVFDLHKDVLNAPHCGEALLLSTKGVLDNFSQWARDVNLPVASQKLSTSNIFLLITGNPTEALAELNARADEFTTPEEARAAVEAMNHTNVMDKVVSEIFGVDITKYPGMVRRLAISDWAIQLPPSTAEWTKIASNTLQDWVDNHVTTKFESMPVKIAIKAETFAPTLISTFLPPGRALLQGPAEFIRSVTGFLQNELSGHLEDIVTQYLERGRARPTNLDISIELSPANRRIKITVTPYKGSQGALKPIETEFEIKKNITPVTHRTDISVRKQRALEQAATFTMGTKTFGSVARPHGPDTPLNDMWPQDKVPNLDVMLGMLFTDCAGAAVYLLAKAVGVSNNVMQTRARAFARMAAIKKEIDRKREALTLSGAGVSLREILPRDLATSDIVEDIATGDPKRMENAYIKILHAVACHLETQSVLLAQMQIKLMKIAPGAALSDQEIRDTIQEHFRVGDDKKTWWGSHRNDPHLIAERARLLVTEAGDIGPDFALPAWRQHHGQKPGFLERVFTKSKERGFTLPPTQRLAPFARKPLSMPVAPIDWARHVDDTML